MVAFLDVGTADFEAARLLRGKHRLRITVADGLAWLQQAMPEAGWPIVIYGHGTGGDYRSFAAGSNMSPADQLAREGIAAFGISLPLHGDRGTAVAACAAAAAPAPALCR